MKMKALLLSLLLLGSISSIAVAQQAPNNNPANNRPGAWKSMSPEERQAKRAQWKQKFQNMSPEERQAFREKKRAQFQNMTPEQKQAFEARRAQRRAERQKNMGNQPH
jgi:Spy/CpxP family protein refolding chaperone